MISLSDKAKTKIETLLKSTQHVGIRIGVKTTGCSGLAYVLEYIETYVPESTTINYAQDTFCVVVDKKHNVYLEGLTIDYVKNGLNEGFEFQNPNERDRCGCGESFRV